MKKTPRQALQGPTISVHRSRDSVKGSRSRWVQLWCRRDEEYSTYFEERRRRRWARIGRED
jgi:hypothetical protein